MNIMNRVTWKSMWENRTRTIVTIVGVILSAAMFMAVTTTVYSLWDFLVRGAIYSRGDFYIEYDGANDEQYQALLADSRVETVSDYQLLGYIVEEPGHAMRTFYFGAVDEQFLESMPVRLAEGRLPQNSNEIVIPGMLQRLWLSEPDGFSVGDTVTIEVFQEVEGEKSVFAKKYTVVGVHDDIPLSSGRDNPYRYAFTIADGEQGQIQSHMLFVKTGNPYDSLAMASENYGSAAWLNNSILEYYGIFNHNANNELVLLLALILCVVIMAVSVSLISNAFAISVSERTKQFGLLMSIGATKKQIQKSVRFEAFVVGIIGIPAGLLLGYTVVVSVMDAMKEPLMMLFAYDLGGNVPYYTVVSWLSILVAVAICSLDIFISVWIPSRRAMCVTPMESIRQSTDYQVRARDMRRTSYVGSFIGLPAVLAEKYYNVSNRKYRATVTSLSISLILFVVANQLSTSIIAISDASAENYDLECSITGAGRDEAIEQIRNHADVEETAVAFIQNIGIVVNEADMEQFYLNNKSEVRFVESQWRYDSVEIVYLEDRVLEEHLSSLGIPFRDDDTKAYRVIQSYQVLNQDRDEWEMYQGCPIRDGDGQIAWCANNLPDTLLPDGAQYQIEATEDGEPLYVVYRHTLTDQGFYEILESDIRYYVASLAEKTDDGKMQIHYYDYDPENKTRGQTIQASQAFFIPEVRIGECLELRPFGIQKESITGYTLVMPLSTAPEALFENGPVSLMLNVSDLDAVWSAIEELQGDQVEISVLNHSSEERNQKALAQVIQACALGFIIILSVITCANVFNTISTNISLRRRDFGMLRSLGFTQGDLYRMLAMECMNYGLRTLLWSIPISIGLCYGIHKIVNQGYIAEFALPWNALGMGTAMIFVVIFAGTAYAVVSIRKDNPIDAIRMENT